MDLHIMFPNSKEQKKIAWLEVNTPTGNYIIQPGHAPMVVSLVPHEPVIYCLPNGNQETITPARGIAHINRDHITLLLAE